MDFSRILHPNLPFLSLSLGLVSKAASVGVLVVLILKVVTILTRRSPYEHIHGPKPSSMLGKSS